MKGLATAGAIILISTVCLIIACLIAYAVIMQKRHYRCPYCGFRFKVSSLRSFFAKSNGTDKLLICPNCGKSGFMEFKHDDEKFNDANSDSNSTEYGESKLTNKTNIHDDDEENTN